MPSDRGAGHTAQVDGIKKREYLFHDVIHIHFDEVPQKVQALTPDEVPSPVNDARFA